MIGNNTNQYAYMTPTTYSAPLQYYHPTMVAPMPHMYIPQYPMYMNSVASPYPNAYSQSANAFAYGYYGPSPLVQPYNNTKQGKEVLNATPKPSDLLLNKLTFSKEKQEIKDEISLDEEQFTTNK